MHNTHLGSHAAPHVNKHPMVREPHDFLHGKTLPDGQVLSAFEEGVDDLKIGRSVEFQKYFGKKQAYMYVGYDHKKDMKNDAFLSSLGKEEKKKFDEGKNTSLTAKRVEKLESITVIGRQS